MKWLCYDSLDHWSWFDLTTSYWCPRTNVANSAHWESNELEKTELFGQLYCQETWNWKCHIIIGLESAMIKSSHYKKAVLFLIADADVFIDFLVLEVQLNVLQQGVLTTSLYSFLRDRSMRSSVLNENKLSNLQRTKLVQLDIQVLPRLRWNTQNFLAKPVR